MSKPVTLAEAIDVAVEREGLGVEGFCRKYDIPSAHFYRLRKGQSPVPERVRGPLLKLKAAGVKHPLLDLVA